MSIYSDIGLSTSENVTAATAVSSGKTGSYNLTQTDFLSLLTTELAFQDPTSPTDNKEMVSQLAQISTVDGINKLNGTVGGLSDIVTSQQALMVSGLVGQTVLLDQNTGYSSGTGFAGVVKAQSEGHYEGNVPFSWSGTDVNGNQVPDGYYTVMATGMVNGESQTIGTQVYGKVQSVVLGSGSSEATLNVEGFGTVSLNDVLEVGS